MQGEAEPSVWVVAGCLFEVALPTAPGGRWCHLGPVPEVTLLSDDVRESRHHFRFRAEAAGTVAGSVSLQFRREPAGRRVQVQVLVAPEQVAGT